MSCGIGMYFVCISMYVSLVTCVFICVWVCVVLFVLVVCLYVFKCLSHRFLQYGRQSTCCSSGYTIHPCFHAWEKWKSGAKLANRRAKYIGKVSRVCVYVCGLPVMWRKKTEIPEFIQSWQVRRIALLVRTHLWELCEKSWSMEICSPCVGTEIIFVLLFEWHRTILRLRDEFCVCMRASIQHKYIHITYYAPSWTRAP